MKDAVGFRDLVNRAQQGDVRATEQLLALIRPLLETLASRFVDPKRPDASASDLAQEVWLRAWQKLSQFQGGDDDEGTLRAFHGWLERIVERLGLNAIRDRNAQQRKPPGPLQRLDGSTDHDGPQPAANQPSPSALVQAEEQIQRVRQTLARIEDETDQTIIRLRFFEGISLRQIAERLGTNHEAVRQQFHAVLRRMERELES